MFTAALFTTVKTWKQTKRPSIDEWIKNTAFHKYNRILVSHKKERDWVICRDVDGPKSVKQSVVSQREKNKHVY